MNATFDTKHLIPILTWMIFYCFLKKKNFYTFLSHDSIEILIIIYL